MHSIIAYLKNRACEQWRRGNWPLGALILLLVAALVIIGLLVEDGITNAAKQAIDKSTYPVVYSFAAAWGWPLTPFLFALALYLIASVFIGLITARINRPAPVGGNEESSEFQGMRDRVKFLEARDHQLSEPAGWMNTMMSDDRQRLNNRVNVINVFASGENLKNGAISHVFA